MKNLLLIADMDIKESFRSKWFLLYILVFIGLVGTLFISGVTDSRVAGFTGLTRLLLLFIQICFVILPIFILITTVRSISYDRELNTLEYLLSYPINLNEYYFGKVLGRAFIVIFPIFITLLFMVIISAFKSKAIPFNIIFLYSILLSVMSFVFLSFGFFISSIVKSQEMALAVAFFCMVVFACIFRFSFDWIYDEKLC